MDDELPAIRWYDASRRHKAPLLDFMLEGLTAGGCRIIWHTAADKVPFLISFEAPNAERIGVLVYAFFANAKVTKNRPADEHRFQVKLGGDAKRLLQMHDDPAGLLTTLLVGIDPERRFLVGADAAANNPSPMFKSVEFKSGHARTIMEAGWNQWERDRRASSDEPVEVLVGARQDRLLDYVRFERAAKGLDQGPRHLLAERYGKASIDRESEPALGEMHRLEKELGLSRTELFDMIDGNRRLKMAVRGGAAEVHLQEFLGSVPGVEDCRREDGEGMPDISLRWQGRPLLVECKNVLRAPARDGSARLDFQRTRASKADPCSRYYKRSDFAIVAACLHSVTERWEFRFAETADLPPHSKCKGRIASAIPVGSWTADPVPVLDSAARRA